MSELGCSTISFRHRTLSEALAAISRLGMTGVDLGGLPGVCEHFPVERGRDVELAEVVEAVETFRVEVWALNVDPGALNDPGLDERTLVSRGHELAAHARRLGAALIVPCGAPARTPFVDEAADLARTARGLRVLSSVAAGHGVRLLVEAPHHHRFCHGLERLRALLELVPADVAGLVYDVSHVVAGGVDEVALAAELAERIEHVHLRDAVPGEINRSIGRGAADFAGVVDALRERGYAGRYVLELETHDVAEHDREAVAESSRDAISALLRA
ncbi:sugar phosphate isomerase/epimerase family protein [Actinopolyspora saharensis]|uniref:Sugar phosphate isomerase/epimerase n=1 Tax=Actinopolyspora saharensis TaxID=995062 RepID=A0A1H0YVH1_9ACTN|nr:sugar phosphate isomerase/epimerase [Actinopolyspora saharensis]SDQ19134.1 Sugar phosphate isomerase/epimerase [Actinopolyspora saharensis]